AAASYTRLIRRGNRFYSNELYNEALRYYLESKGMNDKVPEPVFNAGASYYKMEAYYKSVESFTDSLQYIKNEKNKADVYFNLGNTYFRLGDYQKAAENYMKGLEIDPVDLNTKYNLELTLEKMQEKEQEEKDENEPESGHDENQKEGNGTNKPSENSNKNEQTENNIEQEKTSDSDVPNEKDLTQEEAERLINALNSDQTDIINDIIKYRVGRTQNEKDW
ncbi:MAG: tetratricopeptide repeat protein, partial [Spirochaetes bacterium]|nr:tetratricopeptide repeat protein [Spirochaetota bacterium]